MRVKFDQETMGLSSVMEKMTRTHVKDCFRDGGVIYFIIGAGELGRAIGKGGITIKKVQQRFGKPIRVIEYSDTVTGFVKNIIFPIEVAEISENAGVVEIKDEDRKKKGILVGRDGTNIKMTNKIVKRFFPIQEVKVV